MDVLKILTTPVLRRAAVRLVPTVVAAFVAAQVLPASAQSPQSGSAEAAGDPARDLVAAAQARLAFSLIDRVAVQGKDATVSPASLAAALNLVSIGADDKMKRAIAKVLGFPHDRTDAAFTALASIHDKLSKGGDSFTFADMIVFAPSAPPDKILVPGLKENNVPFDIVDLSSVDGVKKINDWVKGVTHDMIPQLLDGPVSNASFAALNALHFKGRWKNPFDPQQTQQVAFNGLDGKTDEVPMMRLAKGARLFRTEKIGERNSERDFVAIDLPFAGDRFSMVVVTMTNKPASAKDFTAVAGWLSGRDFTPHSGDLAMPRFSASGNEDLLPVLDSLGLKDARRSPTALVRFGSGVDLSQVAQRAVIEVNEEGAEAAAATAAIGTRMIEADDSIHMIVDKPFVYALRDKTTGMILIAGYVGQPPKTS